MNNCRKVTVKGKVVSGVGEGGHYVRLYKKILKERLGLDPYPGTLNIDVGTSLEEIWYTFKPIVIEPKERSLCKVAVLPAKIRDYRGFVVRAEKTIHGWNILEFIAPVSLRKKYGLKDGDIIEVTIYDSACIND